MAALQEACSELNRKPSERTIRTILKEGGARPRRPQSVEDRHNDPLLRTRIAILFYWECLEDAMIVDILAAEGWHMPLSAFVRMRKKLGMKRRLKQSEVDRREAEFKRIIKEELDEGRLSGYGRNLLQAHFATKEDRMLLLGRDRLFKYVKELDPIGLYNRTSSFTRRRGTYTTPGPDFCWSMDAHCKLEDFGFQIYAAIDAETSMVGAAAHYGRTPHLIRVDKGKETLLLADGHFQHALRVRGPETTFTECFCFGTSVRNVRIESWWQQMTRAGLGQWGDYFRRLVKEGQYSKASKMDRISMKFIYTPMIRKQLQGFVRTWNKHKIRRQRNRPHVIPGRPHVLYNYSQRPNQGDPIDTEYIKALNETTKGWKIHEYLPKTTIEFCKDILRREGFPSGRAARRTLYNH
ncbi:unnamed protein product [Zymoseptoria tritici ST99CH_1A5]|uniref:Integrase core domain-containing protein n=1 Tax=Zymoseptoria tritici ST99CH_1A5 TaxID=1276529 RepID=A0A1Y6L8I2_ZYMTR|nr:unnamed protein product [Zymoseptoria tritici ST99CH_1A5]